MKNLLFFLMVLSFAGCKTGEGDKNALRRVPSSQVKNEVLVGEIERNDLLSPPHASWFNSNFDRYRPEKEDLDLIVSNLPGIDSIKIFMGTWCIDSRREVPKFFKLLKWADYDLAKVYISSLKLNKTAPNDPQDSFDVIMIPTFIFYKEGRELNRFVEYPRETFEKDIAKIVSQQPYRHSYYKEVAE